MTSCSLSSDQLPENTAQSLPSMVNGKTSIAPPQVSVDTNMELDNMPSSEVKLPLHEDIMQLARLGEIGPVRKLFEEGKFDATYKDEQEITPLHVCNAGRNWVGIKWSLILSQYSGLQSIITMRSANSSSSQELMSTRKEAILSQHPQCGRRRGAITISSTCFYRTEQTHSSPMFKATTSCT